MSAAAVGLIAVAVATPASADDAVVFGDVDLAACVARNLDLAGPADITESMLASLTELTCTDTIVNSFEGIEGATALTKIQLDGGFSLNDASNRELAAQEFFTPLTALENLTVVDFIEAFPYDSVDPAPLADIPSLRELSVRIPYRYGVAWVGGASNLESLKVTAGSSISDFAPIAALTGLTYLSLDYAQGSLLPIAGLTKLRTLRLPDAEATDWESLAGLTELRDVDLTYSNVPDLAWLADADHLTSVLASATDVSDLSPLLGAQGLEGLHFSSTKVTDFSPVATFPVLKELGATCPDNADPSPVADVTTLEVLYLTYCGIDDATMFARMTNLRELWVGNNKLHDLRPLAGLTHLTTLWALGQRVELPPVDACVPQELPELANVDGSRPKFSGPSSSWGALENGIMTWAVTGASPSFTFGTYDSRFAGTVIATTNPGPDYANCAFASAPTVTISGQALVGATLTASFNGTWSPSPAGWTNNLWMRDGIDGRGSDLSYVVQPSDAGHVLTFSLQGNRPGFEVKKTLSNAIYIPLVFASDWAPTLSPAPSVGATATIAPPPGFPVNGTMKCTWMLNGVVVSSGAGCAYTPPTAAGGKALAATATLSAPGYTSAVFSVPAKTILKQLGALNMIGRINGDATSWTVDAGAKLTASLPTFHSPAPTSVSIRWTRNGVAIAGASGLNYTTTSADAGTKVGVTFTAKRSGYQSETSDAIDVITVRKVFTATAHPVVSGSLSAGSTLKATAGSWNPSPSTLTYQWYRNGTKITGATKSTYVTRSTDAGAKFAVKVTAKKWGYTTATRTSASVTVLKKLTATPTPTISGTPRVKSTLTAKPGAWGPGTVTLSYQWYRNGKAISGATERTYRPGAKDAFAAFKVKVTGKKSGYYSVSRTSASVTASGIKYASCTALSDDYPGGVAKASTTPGILGTTFVSPKLYDLNAARDGDMDGWACEP